MNYSCTKGDKEVLIFIIEADVKLYILRQKHGIDFRFSLN